VKNYADKYVDDVTNEYIIKNIKTSMKTYDKLVKVAKFIADIDYDYHYQSVNDMIILGGGDCWASTGVAIYFAKKLGFEAWARNGNKDPGAGSGHRNALVYDGRVYIYMTGDDIMYNEDGSVKEIRRAETVEDYFATLEGFRDVI
jgi:hypothetical protein